MDLKTAQEQGRDEWCEHGADAGLNEECVFAHGQGYALNHLILNHLNQYTYSASSFTIWLRMHMCIERSY